MIESPLIQEIEAKNSHGLILALLQSRFKNVPEDITEELTNIIDKKRLVELNKAAATCKDLKAFRKRLSG
jgi:hypothetical protein